MVISRKDYSRMLNANSSKYAAKQLEIANNEYVANADYVKGMRNAQALGKVADSMFGIMRIIGDSSALIKGYQQALEAEADAEADKMNTEYFDEVNDLIFKLPFAGEGAPSIVNGEFQMGSILEQKRSEGQQKIDDMIGIWPKSVIEREQKFFDEQWRGVKVDQQKIMYSRMLSSTEAQRELLLENALENDVKSGSPQQGLSLIDSFKEMSSEEKANASGNYMNLFEKGFETETKKNRTDEVVSIASSRGAGEAFKVIDSWGLSPTESANYRDMAVSAEASSDRNLTYNVANSFNNYVEEAKVQYMEPNAEGVTGSVIISARDRVMQDIESLDADKREKAIQSLDAAQSAVILRELTPELDSLVIDPTSEGYTSFKTALEDGGKYASLFYGMDEYRSDVIRNVDENLALMKDKVTKEEANRIQDLKNQRGLVVDFYANEFWNGKISADAAIEGLKFTNLAYQEIAGDQEVGKSIRKIMDAGMPSEFKDVANRYMNTLEKTYTDAMKNSKIADTPAMRQKMDHAMTAAWSSVMNFFRNNASGKLSTTDVEAFLSNVQTTFSLEAFNQMETVNSKYEAADQDVLIMDKYKLNINRAEHNGTNAPFSLSVGSKQKTMKEYDTTYDFMAKQILGKDENGNISFGSENIENSYGLLENTGSEILQRLHLTPAYAYPHMTGGKMTGLPEFYMENGDRYFLDKEYLYKYDKDKDEYRAVESIDGILNDPHIDYSKYEGGPKVATMDELIAQLPTDMVESYGGAENIKSWFEVLRRDQIGGTWSDFESTYLRKE